MEMKSTMHISKPGLITLGLLLGVFFATAPISAMENEAIKGKIDRFEKGMTTKNIGLVMQSFKKDAVWQGFKAYPYVMENTKELFDHYKSIRLERTGLKFSSHGQQIASSADYRVRATTKQGKPVDLKTSFIFLWERGPGGWQIIAVNPLLMVPTNGSVANDLKKITPGNAGQEPQATRLSPVADSYVYAYSYRNWNKNNWGAYNILKAGWHPTGGESRAYLKFDLSGLNPRKMNKAILRLYHYHTGGSHTLKLGVHKVTGKWIEGQGTYHSGQTEKPATLGEITWIDQPPFEKATVATFEPGAGANKYVDVDITKLVKEWLSGQPNYGLVITPIGALNRSTRESAYGLFSREHEDKTKRPVLIIQSVD